MSKNHFKEMQDRMFKAFSSTEPLNALNRELMMRRGKSWASMNKNNNALRDAYGQNFVTVDTALKASRSTATVWKFNKKTGNFQILSYVRPIGMIKTWISKAKAWVH